MKIAVFPIDSQNNKFLDIFISCMRRSGAEIFSYKDIFKKGGSFRSIDAVMLNWYENTGKKGFQCLRHHFKKIAKILLLKVFGCKIVYVLHNKTPHDFPVSPLIRWLITFYCCIADRVILLSESSESVLVDYIGRKAAERRRFVIPHPNYIGAYPLPPKDYAPAHRFPPNKLILLFVGAVRPYKNIELIIDFAKKNQELAVHFVVAGKPNTGSYAEKLMGLASSLPNVTLMQQYISDNELVSLIACCDALILPYNIVSSMNSGVAILAFSNRKTVICPEIATIQDYPEELVYSYSYENEADHYLNMACQINAIYKDFVKNKSIINDKGEKLYQNVLMKNSLEIVSDKFCQLWNELGLR